MLNFVDNWTIVWRLPSEIENGISYISNHCTILPLLSRNVIWKRCYYATSQCHVNIRMHPSNQAHSYVNTHSHRFHNKMYLIKQKITVSRGDNWLKIHQKSKYVNELMTLCCQKVTKQGKMCGFLTTKIENSAFVIFTRYEKIFSRSWYHKATAPISTIIFTLCPS